MQCSKTDICNDTKLPLNCNKDDHTKSVVRPLHKFIIVDLHFNNLALLNHDFSENLLGIHSLIQVRNLNLIALRLSCLGVPNRGIKIAFMSIHLCIVLASYKRW